MRHKWHLDGGCVLILGEFGFVLASTYLFKVVQTVAMIALVVVRWTNCLTTLYWLPLTVALLAAVGTCMAALVRLIGRDVGAGFPVRATNGVACGLIVQKFVGGTLPCLFRFDEVDNLIELHILICVS